MYVIDERNGEICHYIRSRRNKWQAIDLAPQIYGVPRDEVIRILQQEGLMDQNGKLIEPIRLTGKEKTMERERKKAAYYWSAKRKEQLQELYQSGLEAPTIADQLGTTTDVIYEAISKFNITRTRKVEPVPPAEQEPPVELANPAEQEPDTMPAPPAPRPTAPVKRNPKPEPWINEYNLRELNRLINEAMTQAQDAPTLFLKDHCYEAFMALGKLDIILRDAQQILRKVFPRSPRPPDAHPPEP